jgi:phosphoketolase
MRCAGINCEKEETDENKRTNTNPLSPDLLRRMDAYWQAANYLSVGQIYLCDNRFSNGPSSASTSAAFAGSWGDARVEPHLCPPQPCVIRSET